MFEPSKTGRGCLGWSDLSVNGGFKGGWLCISTRCFGVWHIAGIGKHLLNKGQHHSLASYSV